MIDKSPRTEVETFVALWEVIQDRYARPAVRRIVEEALEAARTEGRQEGLSDGIQQAVRDAKEQLRPPPHLIGYSVVCEVLDRVAGLNAPATASEHVPESPEVTRAKSFLQREGIGDASESPPLTTLVCPHGVQWNYSCDDCESDEAAAERWLRANDLMAVTHWHESADCAECRAAPPVASSLHEAHDD